MIQYNRKAGQDITSEAIIINCSEKWKRTIRMYSHLRDCRILHLKNTVIFGGGNMLLICINHSSVTETELNGEVLGLEYTCLKNH